MLQKMHFLLLENIGGKARKKAVLLCYVLMIVFNSSRQKLGINLKAAEDIVHAATEALESLSDNLLEPGDTKLCVPDREHGAAQVPNDLP